MNTVLHLIPTLGGGGAERQLTMLALEQARRGMRVHVGVRLGGVHEATLRKGNATLHFLGNHRGPSPRLLMSIRMLMRRIRPDIMQTWLPQMDVLGGLGALSASVPWILSERCSDMNLNPYSGTEWLRLWLGRGASAVVANSEDGASYWRGRMAGGRFVGTIANAVDVAAIRGASAEGEPSVGDGRHLVLVVGRLAAQKGLDVILDAVSRLRHRSDLRVMIVGEGPLRQEMERTLSSLELRGVVTLVPYRADWWKLLKNASVLVSMSRFEGQPNVVLETMAAGCPLIISDIPAHREILDESAAIIVPLNNSSLLAGAIESLLADPVAASQRAREASARVDQLTIARAADAYQRIYDRLLRVGAK